MNEIIDYGNGHECIPNGVGDYVFKCNGSQMISLVPYMYRTLFGRKTCPLCGDRMREPLVGEKYTTLLLTDSCEVPISEIIEIILKPHIQSVSIRTSDGIDHIQKIDFGDLTGAKTLERLSSITGITGTFSD